MKTPTAKTGTASPVAIIFLLLAICLAPTTPSAQAEKIPGLETVDLSIYSRLLQTYVRDGLYDYDGFKKSHRDTIDLGKYLYSLRFVNLTDWPREKKIAFWIDAYNATLIDRISVAHPIVESLKTVLIQFPANSPRQIQGLYIRKLQIAGREASPEIIHHRILEKELGDPRFLFAISFGTKGGARLLNRPLQSGNLKKTLNRCAKNFIADRTKIRFESESRILSLSPLFKWNREFISLSAGGRDKYKKKWPDLTPEERAVVRFISEYMPRKTIREMRSGPIRIDFLDFDWTLDDIEKK